MADEIAALAAQIARHAQARFEAMANERGMPMPGVLTQRPPNMFEAFSHLAGDADAFATGYDSGGGTTTMAFTLDVSVLGGPDILTG